MTRAGTCPHCEPNHGSPHRCAWGVWVAPEVDADGQPTHLRVQPTAGAHVAQEDADWLFELIRDRVCVHRDPVPAGPVDMADRDPLTGTALNLATETIKRLHDHIRECHRLQNNVAGVLGVETDWDEAGRTAVLDAACRLVGNLADAERLLRDRGSS